MKPPSPDTDGKATEPPAPEVLKPQTEDVSRVPEDTGSSAAATPASGKSKRLRRGTYRPSHKATFISVIVVVAILAVNAAVIAVVIKSQSKNKDQASQADVTISQGTLDKLGVSRNSIGLEGVELTVNPDARFGGSVKVGGDVSVSGELRINGKFSAGDASFAQLQAGNTALSELNVNGSGTLTNLNLRNDLVVTGSTRLQGAATFTQLVTVNNNLNVSGSMAVGGLLSAGRLHAGSVVSDGTLTVGGHIVTQGSAPKVGSGSAVGASGTVSISGNDTAGTVAVNAGVGAGGGIVANVSFRSQYGNIPHVVVTPVGAGVGSVYVTRSVGGFSIGVNGALGPGGYAFDYIVMQ
jgi:hypothetical protein